MLQGVLKDVAPEGSVKCHVLFNMLGLLACMRQRYEI